MKRSDLYFAGAASIFGGLAFYTHVVLGLFYAAIVLIVLALVEMER